MQRYDKFLSESIPKYLKNSHINEIIICDETGEDYEIIISNFDDPKIFVYKNNFTPFLFHTFITKLEK
jgi:hypothetical protein